MEAHEQYSLINQKKWTELLQGSPVGEHTFTLPSMPDIHSLKSVAYRLNTDKLGRIYSVRSDAVKKLVTVTIKQV